MVESQFEGMWIGDYDSKGDNHIQYINLAKELISKLEDK